MKKIAFLLALVIAAAVVVFSSLSPSQAQPDLEKQFMQLHQKDLETFMTKCSGCHSLQRVFAKKRTKEEWAKILEQMAAKPHAMISPEEKARIQKWIDLMEMSLPVGP